MAVSRCGGRSRARSASAVASRQRVQGDSRPSPAESGPGKAIVKARMADFSRLRGTVESPIRGFFYRFSEQAPCQGTARRLKDFKALYCDATSVADP
jgi:hypothetical protein